MKITAWEEGGAISSQIENRCGGGARPHPTVQVSRAATEDGHQGDREPERSSLWAHPLSFTRHGTAQQGRTPAPISELFCWEVVQNMIGEGLQESGLGLGSTATHRGH